MKFYETMFILKPTLVEEEIKARIEFFKEVLTKNGAEIEACLDMGMRNLAYEIKKNKRGYYFVIYFKASPKLIAELERNYRINEEVLRFIVIKYESKKEQKAWHTLVDRANGKIESKPSKMKKTESAESDTAQPRSSQEETKEATQS